MRAALSDSQSDDEFLLKQEDENEMVLRNLISELNAMDQIIIPKSTMRSMADKRGFQGSPGDMGEILMGLGVTLYGGKQWDIRKSTVLSPSPL